MSYFLLRFRQKVLDGTLQPEKMAGQPLCMAQYRRMFSVCRVPGEHTDELVEWEPRDYRHIIVLLENKFYAFDVLDKYGNIMSPDQLTMCVPAQARAASPHAVPRGATGHTPARPSGPQPIPAGAARRRDSLRV